MRGDGDWRQLVQQTFNNQANRLEFVGEARWGRLGQLRIRALDGPVDIDTVRVRFADNRAMQEITVRQTLRSGEETAPLNLEGGSRPIEAIVVNLSPRRSGGPASVAVLGSEGPRRDFEDFRNRPERPVYDRDPPRGGWNQLATRSFNPQANRIELIGESRWGRLGQLQIRALDGPVDIDNIRVRFADNSAVQEITVRQTLRSGDATLPLDLDGAARPLEVIVINLRPRGAGRQAAIEVLGMERPQRRYERNQWSAPSGYFGDR